MRKQNPLPWGVRTWLNMPIPFRVLFFIGAGGATFHLALWYTMLLIAGYIICGFLDQLQKDRKEDQKREALDDEVLWETDPDHPKSETLRELSRVKLPREHQIGVTRVAELLRKTI